MPPKSIWRRPHLYVAAVAALLVLAIFPVGRDVSKMDYAKLTTRAGWQLPDRVVESLAIKPGDRIADIGAGGGYFTFRLADAVGSEGKVYAVEVDDKLVEKLERKARKRGYSNVVVIKGEFDDPLLPDGEIDLVFLCNTYHHIEDRPGYFDHLRTDLERGGRVAIVDMKFSPLVRLFFLSGHSITMEAMQQEMEKANYRKQDDFAFLPAQNFVIFSALTP
jgi:ubiquinone/menaquinone biosynthesis C-methylase UbiE